VIRQVSEQTLKKQNEDQKRITPEKAQKNPRRELGINKSQRGKSERGKKEQADQEKKVLSKR